MSGVPVVLAPERLEVLIVGGGRVAARRAAMLAERGARVRVVALSAGEGLRALAARGTLALAERAYDTGDIAGATLVIAATNDRAVNARVAADAGARSRLVNVADAPDEGNCVMAAAHVVGDLVIGVTAGSVPAAAVRIRDAIAARFDGRYAESLRALGALRRRFLGEDRRQEWKEASASLAGDEFCDLVERGELTTRVATWR